MDLLKFVIYLGAEQQALLAEEPDDRKAYTIDIGAFHTAIKLGRTAILTEIIKATGVGIPLNELIQKSGVEIKEKPRYYQGLSVGALVGKSVQIGLKPRVGNVRVFENKIAPPLAPGCSHGQC
jgi:hypothetical protein